MKKPERFVWDDNPDNNHGWYDAEEMDNYLRQLNSENDLLWSIIAQVNKVEKIIKADRVDKNR